MRIDASLLNDFVDRNKNRIDRHTPRIKDQLQIEARFPCGTGEMGEAKFQFTQGLYPAYGEISAPLSRSGLKDSRILIHQKRQPWSSIDAREISFTKPGQQIEIQHPPIPKQREIDHRLTKLLLSIRIFNIVCLIDNVHQVPGFRNAPENLANTCSKFPGVGNMNPG